MQQQTILLKGMVCNRCLMMVESELKKLGHIPLKVSLGEVSYQTDSSYDQQALMERFSSLGFELLEDKKVRLSRQVKQIVEEVYSGDFDFPDHFRLANYLKRVFQHDYAALNDAFMSTEKKSIEQYMIECRIQKVTEFLVYTNLTLSDIAFKLNFNSVAHISAQFKQQTGLTTSFFKEIRRQKAAAAFSEN